MAEPITETRTKTLRTFIALELAPEIKDILRQIQEDLKKEDPEAARSVRWVNPNSIHLTLKFLGDTPAAQVNAITAAMGQAATRIGLLSLSLAQAGCFPNLRQPRVVWVGVSGDLPALGLLQTAVEEAVSPLGFPSENRGFSPHLTLGRVRDDATPEQRARLGKAVEAIAGKPHPFAVDQCSLMRSDLTPAGPIYVRLASVALGSGHLET